MADAVRLHGAGGTGTAGETGRKDGSQHRTGKVERIVGEQSEPPFFTSPRKKKSSGLHTWALTFTGTDWPALTRADGYSSKLIPTAAKALNCGSTMSKSWRKQGFRGSGLRASDASTAQRSHLGARARTHAIQRPCAAVRYRRLHRPFPVCVAAGKLAPPKLRRFHVLPCVSIRAHFNHGVDDLPPDAVSPLCRDVDVFAACAIVQDICTAVRASANGQIQSIPVSLYIRAGSPHTSTHSAHEHLYSHGNM